MSEVETLTASVRVKSRTHRLQVTAKRGAKHLCHRLTVVDGMRITHYELPADCNNFSSGLITRAVQRYLLDELRPCGTEQRGPSPLERAAELMRLRPRAGDRETPDRAADGVDENKSKHRSGTPEGGTTEG